MLNPKHPTAVLRLAWKTVRLDSIRAATAAVIEELQELNRQDILPLPVRCGTPRAPVSASVAALLACCEELREESGMTRAPSRDRRANLPSDPAWLQGYTATLDRYRIVAAVSLNRRLAA